MNATKYSLLCVDDQEGLVAGMRLTLRKHFHVVAVTSGKEALEKLQHEGPFAVLITDMRMPGISGVDVLKAARELAPETQRILLTGFADADCAAQAVNEGDVFRYLTKPCSPPDLRQACEAARDAYIELNSRQALHAQTQLAWAHSLANCAILQDPAAAGHLLSLVHVLRTLAAATGEPGAWKAEIALILMETARIELGELVTRGAAAPQIEVAQVASVSRADESEELLDMQYGDPCLAEFTQLARASIRMESLDEPGEWGRLMRICNIASRFMSHVLDGLSPAATIDLLRMKTRHPRFGLLFDILERSLPLPVPKYRSIMIPLHRIRPGLTLGADIHSGSGRLLLAKNQRLTPATIERIHGLAESARPARIPILVFGREPDEHSSGQAPASAKTPTKAA